jgi:hypothetical protein
MVLINTINNMLENANPKTNPITTILGIVMCTIALCMWVAPMFVTLKKDISDSWYIPTGILMAGLLLIIAPDKVGAAISKFMDKEADKI